MRGLYAYDYKKGTFSHSSTLKDIHDRVPNYQQQNRMKSCKNIGATYTQPSRFTSTPDYSKHEIDHTFRRERNISDERDYCKRNSYAYAQDKLCNLYDDGFTSLHSKKSSFTILDDDISNSSVCNNDRDLNKISYRNNNLYRDTSLNSSKNQALPYLDSTPFYKSYGSEHFRTRCSSSVFSEYDALQQGDMKRDRIDGFHLSPSYMKKTKGILDRDKKGFNKIDIRESSHSNNSEPHLLDPRNDGSFHRNIIENNFNMHSYLSHEDVSHSLDNLNRSNIFTRFHSVLLLIIRNSVMNIF